MRARNVFDSCGITSKCGRARLPVRYAAAHSAAKRHPRSDSSAPSIARSASTTATRSSRRCCATFLSRRPMLPQFAHATSKGEPLAVEPVPGLSRNWRQFSLLVLVNAFVGAMVGLERAVLPVWAAADFGLTSKTAILSFIVAFGAVKAVTNLVAGRQAERVGRKSLLVAGWIAGLPIPFMLLWAPSWAWVTAA